nr:hypothetical protein [Tanacetum cinerariifolium]
MSRDVITVGSTMRIPLLYRGEYSQWRERFMNYLEEQTDGEAMIKSIQNGDQPLPVVAQVKEKQEKEKIGSKPDNNEKRGEAEKSLKQLQWVEEEKLSKTQKEWPKTQTQSKAIQVFKE